MTEQGWWTDGTIRLHYLTSGDAPGLTPLVYVPGALGKADDFRPEMERLSPRRTAAISPRGLGLSSAPARGYGLDDRARDLDTVLTHLALPSACVMAFSLGVPVALQYAARHPDRIAGLILLDYPARYPDLSDRWVDRSLPFARQHGIPEHVIHRIAEEARATELWNDLPGIRTPVLIVKGGDSTSISPPDLDRYRTSLPQARIEVLEDAGHEVYRSDYERFMRLIDGFLRTLDP